MTKRWWQLLLLLRRCLLVLFCKESHLIRLSLIDGVDRGFSPTCRIHHPVNILLVFVHRLCMYFLIHAWCSAGKVVLFKEHLAMSVMPLQRMACFSIAKKDLQSSQVKCACPYGHTWINQYSSQDVHEITFWQCEHALVAFFLLGLVLLLLLLEFPVFICVVFQTEKKEKEGMENKL